MDSAEAALFFVGGYSRPGPFFPHASGKGVVTCALDLATGAIRELHACAEAANATYLARAPGGGPLLVASDCYFDEGNVLAFAVRGDGALRWLSSQPAQGTAVCHVAVDPAGRRVFVASYGNGRLTAHDLCDGLLSPADPVVRYEGRGPNAGCQEAAHAHQAVVSPCGRWLHVCDLGSDRIWVHDLQDRALGCRGIALPPGYGPRHLVHHPGLPRTYVLCELNAHLLTCARDDRAGDLGPLADQETLPSSCAVAPSAASIRMHPSGRSLAVSNRGHDSVTVFAIDPVSGLLTFAARFASGGEHPRDMNFDPSGAWLVVANLLSNRLVPFRFDPASGLPTGEQGPVAACGTPACVLF